MATGITGRLIRRTTKEPLQGITVVAVNASTGAESSTSTTTDTKGFFELNGLTSAVYFAKPLVSGDDWDLLPNIAEIYTDEIHIASNGSLTIDGTVSQATDVIHIDITETGAGSPVRGVFAEISTDGGGNITGVGSYITQTGAGNSTALLASVQSTQGSGTSTDVYGIESFATNTGSSGGTISNLVGGSFSAQASGGSATVTTNVGISVSTDGGGTNNRALSIGGPSSGANNYAIYSDATAQSVHAGNFRIGSTTAPTVALDVTGAILGSSTISTTLGLTNGSAHIDTPSGAPGFILRADSATKQRADILRTTTALIFRVRDSNATAKNASLTIADGTGDVAGSVTAGAALLSTGDLTVGDTTASADKNIRIPDNSGNADRVLLRVTSGNHVYVGDIDNNSGDLFLRAGGSSRIQLVSGGAITITDAVNIAVGTTTGTKIGTATTQKLGFFNATPIVQGTAFTQTYSTATHTHSAITATAPSAYAAGANGYSTGAKAQEVRDAAANLVTDITNVKQVVNGIIDDLQALGLLA